MSRYIDADKTAEIVSERHGIPLSELADTFAEVPTADVKEVKHGHWNTDLCESILEPYNNDVDTFACSLCGATSQHPTIFCPFCGARMDGGKK